MLLDKEKDNTGQVIENRLGLHLASGAALAMANIPPCYAALIRAVWNVIIQQGGVAKETHS